MKLKSEDNEKVTTAACELFHIVEDATFTSIRGMQKNGDHQAPNHLYVVLTAAAAAIQLAAKIMSAPEDKTDEEFMAWSEEPANRSAVLAAALLLSRCLLPNKDGLALDFNGTNLCAALEAVKKVTGNNDLSIFNKTMVKAAKECASPTHFFDNSHDEFGGLIPTVH